MPDPRHLSSQLLPTHTRSSMRSTAAPKQLLLEHLRHSANIWWLKQPQSTVHILTTKRNYKRERARCPTSISVLLRRYTMRKLISRWRMALSTQDYQWQSQPDPPTIFSGGRARRRKSLQIHYSKDSCEGSTLQKTLLHERTHTLYLSARWERTSSFI